MTKFINNIKTAALLGGLFGLILFIGYLLGHGSPQGLMIALVFGGATNVIAYFFSDKIALASMRAQEVNESSAPDLVPMVRRLAHNAGLPMPRVYICPHDAPNAFATGRSPRHAAVAVTQGALRLLSYDELEGVIGHELAHVKNRDTLTSCVAAAIAGAISFLAYMAMWFGGGNSREGGNPIAALLVLLFAPIAASIIQLAISRSREYVADADGAAIVGSPHGLINALRKLDAVSRRVPMQQEMQTHNHMFIVQPLSGRGSRDSLFATHPSTENRIRRLLELA
ncbi:MAG: M48 family metalloprotease [Phycisphaera sp.]|nr:M48 family metalloprotease [Phycisphaera sp.]